MTSRLLPPSSLSLSLHAHQTYAPNMKFIFLEYRWKLLNFMRFSFDRIWRRLNADIEQAIRIWIANLLTFKQMLEACFDVNLKHFAA